MSQDDMDDKVKNIFGYLDEQDLLAALESKENVWAKVQQRKQKKKTNQWWLLLFLGGILFAAGWFLGLSQVKESVPQDKKIQEQSIPYVDLEIALNRAESFLISQQKSLDSLQVLNASLSESLTAGSQNNNPAADQKLAEHQTIILRDTIFLTKVEQRIVEKIIRDTIILELPIKEEIEAFVDLSENKPEANEDEAPKTNRAAPPSSVQFNFSETYNKDK
jgi:hypothetical protein